MGSRRFRFERFTLDPEERRLWMDSEHVEVNNRYLDALILLLRERGALVTKDRFLQEVWRGIPVTDEALTQCIKTLRRQLGDNTAQPRFIETVPKHGYRFIAKVEWGEMELTAKESLASQSHPTLEAATLETWTLATPNWRQLFLLLGSAGTVGGGVAGLVGGLLFGFVAALQSVQSGIGTLSVLLVLTSITMFVAIVGAAFVAFCIAGVQFLPGRAALRNILGGGIGGMFVGAIIKFLGIDAFQLLFGQAPREITGASEGLILGAAVGLAHWIAIRDMSSSLIRGALAPAAVIGGASGVLISLVGGRLMGGSLALLATNFPESRLKISPFAGLFGEDKFGALTQLVTAGLEGALFSACIVGAMIFARRNYARQRYRN